MSPRKNRRDGDGGKAVGGAWSYGVQGTEQATDGDWHVRTILASAAVKTYRCPGCDQTIPPGTAHLVAWPADRGGEDFRRHWHRPCWNARLRRGPRR
ncbi:ATP/GTP-binding protein [Actinocorallia longicatena]|uniref:ATP/GTP-binding protein n=1 Tax=Actinocorallia longicatena TaxID=111803 RepID=A0ABP6QKF0_9ACTN